MHICMRAHTQILSPFGLEKVIMQFILKNKKVIQKTHT